MYNDTIKVANKIITNDDLSEIFQKIHSEIENCQKQSDLEKIQNEKYNYEYQKWTIKNYSSNFKVNVDFYDDTEITFDNYYNFMAIFNSRLAEIKRFYFHYNCSYGRKNPGTDIEYIYQHINFNVYESKLDLEINIDSHDNIMNGTYEFIKNKILNAPTRYDDVIKNKNTITNKISFAVGFIPTTILLTLGIFYQPIRHFYAATYILFPITNIIFSFAIGTTIMGGKLERLYSSIVPEKNILIIVLLNIKLSMKMIWKTIKILVKY